MTIQENEAAERKSAVSYDLFRVCVWQRKPSDIYPALGYARRKPGPLLALWRALRGVLGC